MSSQPTIRMAMDEGTVHKSRARVEKLIAPV
jgi:hypothetical protein